MKNHYNDIPNTNRGGKHADARVGSGGTTRHQPHPNGGEVRACPTHNTMPAEMATGRAGRTPDMDHTRALSHTPLNCPSGMDANPKESGPDSAGRMPKRVGGGRQTEPRRR